MRSRWIHHVSSSRGPIVPGPEGFVHGSFLPDVEDTVRVHFAGAARDELHVACIDPRRVGARIDVAATPRGPMPHIHGPVPDDAVAAIVPLDALAQRPDAIAGTRLAFVAFRGMTLLDLIGVHDPVSRIGSMGFEPTTTCEVIAAHDGPLWAADGARFEAARVRPPLDAFDVLIVPGGHGTRTLVDDRDVLDWLATFPRNRLAASVCTGALLLGATGRLRDRRATTHASALDQLAAWGATAVRERVVDEGDLVTAAGVTSAIHLGLHLVRELAGETVATAVARQMEW